mgnify:CR=1 FL=1|tara:strand:- start:7313 stop:8269 length:957 start_codon:yes stop_codon:yes gene_type:complete
MEIQESMKRLFKPKKKSVFAATKFISSDEQAKKLNIRNSSFFPIHDLRNKHNYKEYFIVERDGRTLRRIFLNIFEPEHRELLIFKHYISRRIKFFYKESIGLNILSRDKPWDFRIELSSNETFNVEITSISDNQWNFEMLRNEERYATQSNNEKIPLHELIKINKLFPDNSISMLINDYMDKNTSKKSLIPNPFYAKTISTIGRTDYPEKKLSEIINTSISKKEKKNHSDKENTVLIIDNRTFTLEIDDFQIAFNELGEKFETSPFMEIWLYTGYYSSNDGNEAEYSFIPLKVTNEQRRTLNKMAKKNGLDSKGVIYT